MAEGSLLNDARRMSKQHPAGNLANTICALCGERAGCAGDCPWFSMPQIVAVLEAAEAISEWVQAHGLAYADDGVPNGLVDDLLAALRGEVPDGR